MKKTSFNVLLLILCLVLSTHFLPLVNAADDFWTTLEPMPTARSSMGVAVVNGKMYVIGGTNNTDSTLKTNEMYDPTTDTWTKKEPMSFDRRYFGTAVFQNKIYVIGGDSRSGEHITTNEVYDSATDTWETKTSLPTSKMWVCLEAVNDKIYAIGGNMFGWYPVLSNVTEVYDPATDSWTTAASMPHFEGADFADEITSAVVDNKIYVFSTGERNNHGVFTQIYDPETDEWSSGAPIPVMLDYASAVSTSGIFAPKRIHVLGLDYYDGTNRFELESVHQVYDPEEDEWSASTALSIPRYGLGLATIDDLLYALGGGYNNTKSDENLMLTPIGYNPEFPSWIILPILAVSTLVMIGIINKISKKWLE